MEKTLSFRKILVLAAMVVAGHSVTFADGTKSDSSIISRHVFSTEQLAILEPTYLKEVVVGSTWSHNWFVSVAAGASAFVGTPVGCEDLFGRTQPAVQLSAGKWFTPNIGVRLAYQGFGLKFTDAAITDHEYHHVHADLLWNVIGADRKDELGLHRWTVAPYVGCGIIYHRDNGNKPFSINYGVMAAYRLGKRISVNMEFAGMNTFQNFDGYGKTGNFGDQLYTLSAGLTVNIGKVGWRRVVDANPYRQQNEYLIERLNELLSKDDKKLEDSLSFHQNLVVNGEYSGLASLRARLANKDSADGHPDGSGKSWNGWTSTPPDSIAGQSSDERKLIGVPVYFFFKINTAELTDNSQLQNLINIAKVAKAYNLNVYVDGAADSATGTGPVNDALSEARASYIARLLREQGVPEDAIRITAVGGIDKFSPIQLNRHTRVMLNK